jgi:LysM repeat protein
MAAGDRKAFLETEQGGEISCLFNPAQLQLRQSNQWDADSVPGKDVPDLFYSGAQSGSLSMELMFDTTADGTPVTRHTNAVLDLMKVDAGLPSHDASTNRGRPPWVRFHWGSLHSWKAIVESVDLTFTYFAGDGTPLRAKVGISLKQYEPEANWGPQNPTSGTPRPHRVHVVSAGETLDRIATAHYGDPTLWRAIADANRVANPLALLPGTRLNIPNKADISR